MKQRLKSLLKDKVLGCSTGMGDGRIMGASSQGMSDKTIRKDYIDHFEDMTTDILFQMDWNESYRLNKMGEPDFSRFWEWKI